MNGNMSDLAVPTGAVTTNFKPLGSVTGYLALMLPFDWKSAQAPQPASQSTEKATHNLRKPRRQFIEHSTVSMRIADGHQATVAQTDANARVAGEARRSFGDNGWN
ncbi:MAG TPA: hypothetical protein VEC94_03605 [Pseudolabrys sp.]|nr:hypothetical protein [Pseudolabrys sp.]